jgi:hypothetical protein
MVHKILGFYVIHQSKGSLTLPKIQGWPWARARQAIALGLIPKFFKTLIILYIYIYIYIYITIYKKLKRSIYLKQTFKISLIIIFFSSPSMHKNNFWYLFDVKKLTSLNYNNLKKYCVNLESFLNMIIF